MEISSRAYVPQLLIRAEICLTGKKVIDVEIHFP